jgi:hypothetical protein
MPNLSIERDARAFRDLYIGFMEQIKARNMAINAVGSRMVLQAQPDMIGTEFAFLQFRLICETIALACLAAHGDISQTQQPSIQKAWKPREIMDELEKLNPDFYPFPTKQILGADGKCERTEDVKDDYLTKTDLLKLWAISGNELHMGNLHNIVTKRKKLPSISEIANWNRKIITLLGHHQIQLSDPNYQFWVLMQAEKDGKVHGTLFRRLDAS